MELLEKNSHFNTVVDMSVVRASFFINGHYNIRQLFNSTSKLLN